MAFTKEVLAQAPTITTVNNIATIDGFETLFSNVLSVAAAFGGIILFIIIMVAGFKYLTSGGNPKSVESAKNTLTYAIFGAVLLAAAYLIILLIQNYTGANLSNFDVYIDN
jgi:hypothetical protein